jgi:Domain of unknown function (DUF4352)
MKFIDAVRGRRDGRLLRERCRQFTWRSAGPGGVPIGSWVRQPSSGVGRVRALTGGLLMSALMAGCGTQTVVRTVTSTASGSNAKPSASADSSSSSTSTAQARTAKVGDTLTLSGNGGQSLAVTVDAVMDPLSVGQYDQADSGQRFVGVQVTLKNVGSSSYSDAPSNGATLLSTANEQAKDAIVSGGPCGNDFQSSVNIAPGDTQQGCIPFELPDGQTTGTFQFTMNSGFANQTGQWSLAGANTGATAASTTTSANSSAPVPSGSGPLDALTSYWQNISGHQFSAAYAYLAPGSVSQSESVFVSQEQQAGIQSATFSGHVASNDGSAATVDVDSLITRDRQFGCRAWSGSYQLGNGTGQWLIEKAGITPGPCG